MQIHKATFKHKDTERLKNRKVKTESLEKDITCDESYINTVQHRNKGKKMTRVSLQ